MLHATPFLVIGIWSLPILIPDQRNPESLKPNGTTKETQNEISKNYQIILW
jgi:hypothetical protein